MSFKKDDKNKVRLGLVEREYVEGIAKVLGFGAEKYGTNNWKLGTSEEDILRLKDSLLRHTLAYAHGEELDPETNLSHAYHISCNAMFLDYIYRTNKEKSKLDYIFRDKVKNDRRI